MKKIFTTALVVAVVALFSSCGNMQKDVEKYYAKKKECNDLYTKYQNSKSGQDEQEYNKCAAKLELMGAKMNKKYSGARDSVKYKEYEKIVHVQDSIFRESQKGDKGNNGDASGMYRESRDESRSSWGDAPQMSWDDED